MPEFHNLVGIPRSAAIAYPFGRLFGKAGDREGQKKVLIASLEIFEKAARPGEIHSLSFEWPEEPKKVDWQPAEITPLIKVYLEEIKAARKRELER